VVFTAVEGRVLLMRWRLGKERNVTGEMGNRCGDFV
jgi:hypothetical protein